jgi:aryl-alcohol dehydrogenase-like predicted oxidoreductase
MMPLSRRGLLKLGAGAGASMIAGHAPLAAIARDAHSPARTNTAPQENLITKPIPSTGERLPVIGLGSAQTFNLRQGDTDYAEAQEVVRLFRDLGGKVVDTAPTYGRSERFLGDTVKQFGISDDLFIATKVNVGSGGKEAADAQMRNSLDVFGRSTCDLIQVWNLGGSIARLSAATLNEHMEVLQEWKTAGRIRYLGITTSRDPQYEDTEQAMRDYTLDFVQLDYSIGDRIPEQRLLPLARERGIAVLANRPITTGNLFGRVAGKSLPPWTTEFDCTSWAQFFLKFIVSHPAVTCAIPATSDPGHLRDNMGACLGRLPDQAMRQRMVEHFATL